MQFANVNAWEKQQFEFDKLKMQQVESDKLKMKQVESEVKNVWNWNINFGFCVKSSILIIGKLLLKLQNLHLAFLIGRPQSLYS